MAIQPIESHSAAEDDPELVGLPEVDLGDDLEELDDDDLDWPEKDDSLEACPDVELADFTAMKWAMLQLSQMGGLMGGPKFEKA